jgi:hypothetical protein
VQAPWPLERIVGRNQVDMLSLYGGRHDDVRNGVLQWRHRARLYDSRIFQWYAAASTYVSHVLDKRLLPCPSTIPCPQQAGQHFPGPNAAMRRNIMWGSLDGAAWDYTTQDGPKPRCRGFHVQLLSAVKLSRSPRPPERGSWPQKVVEDLGGAMKAPRPGCAACCI